VTLAQPRPQEASHSDGASLHTVRWRWVAACLGLAAVAFVQDPGRIAADTKLDLFVDPAGLLARALNLWEPLGFFGHLTNQGYGYLFPMGPFFWLGELSGTPQWVVQRLWWSLLLVIAFLGIVRLARLLGVCAFWPRLLAGLTFALGPRMVTELGVLSVEVLPYAVAPWVLIPLVAVARGGSYRRAAALSGLAVCAAGGVNAVASAAVLPLAAWWILTRFTGRARWVLAGWWSLAVILATAWWALPLMILGRYSPPFLDWIESASVTTAITAPDTVLRGTSQWVAYVADAGGPVWPSGWSLVTQPVFIVATGVMAAIGIAGLALTAGRGPRWRSFLIGGLLLGWTAVGMGHLGPWSGLGSEFLRSLLDGALAPLRNTHKFEVLIRLPIAIGVAFAVEWLLRHRRRVSVVGHRVSTAAAGVGVGVVALALGISAVPALTGELTRDRSFVEIPEYWTQASDWLATQESSGRALVLPGASFGIYSWGRTNDEPLQALGQASWVVRDAVPLAGAGAIRWLDAINERVTTGRGSPGLAPALHRAGVEWVVIRNDLDRRRAGSARPESIRQALVRSGGFTPVAGFGPVIPPFRSESTVIDAGLIDANTAVEVWRVDSQAGGSDPRVALRPLTDVVAVSGSSEAIVDLADVGLVNSGTTVLVNGDEAVIQDELGSAVNVRQGISDTYRRSEVIFGRSWNNRTSVLSATSPYRADRAVHDYVIETSTGDSSTFHTVAVMSGGTVSASSSGSDVDAVIGLGPQSDPFSAIDGDGVTAWRTGEFGSGVGQWWQVEWDRPVRIEQPVIRVRFVGAPSADPRDAPAAVDVSTDQGSVITAVVGNDQWQDLGIRTGATSSLRITLVESQGDGIEAGFGIREVELPEPPRRSFAVPGSMRGGPAVFTATRGESAGCLSVGGIVQCADGLALPGSERAGLFRTFTTDDTTAVGIKVRVRPRPGPELDALLSPLGTGFVTAEASSTLVDDPAARAQAAVDGSLETAWIASPRDRRPTLTLSWNDPVTVQGVRLSVDTRVAASLPLTVTVTVNGSPTTAVVDSFGRIRVPPQQATSVTVQFDNTVGLRSLDPITGRFEALPIAISEVSILGAPDLAKGPLPGSLVSAPCGFGPSVFLDGQLVTRTSVTMTVGQALTDAVVSATPCDTGTAALQPGIHDMEAISSSAFTVESVVLSPIEFFTAVSSTEPVEVSTWEAAQRSITIPVGSQPRLLELTENYNPGWVASQGDVTFTPLRVDGWRQAWIIPADTGGDVDIAFAPNRPYRLGLGIGLIAVIALIVMAFIPVRRRHPEAVSPSLRMSSILTASLAVIAATILVGIPGLVIAVVGMWAIWWTHRRFAGTRLRQGRALTAGGAVTASAVIAAFIPWPGRATAGDGWLMILAGLTVVALAALATPLPSDSWTDQECQPEGDLDDSQAGVVGPSAGNVDRDV
jgi:arabinofuranan 3-O-arabinosyltransferase